MFASGTISLPRAFLGLREIFQRMIGHIDLSIGIV
jgi:hypothetical protein